MVIRQNKKQFEKWYNDDFMIKMCVESLPVTLSGFYKLKFEMQIGVYLDYYDSINYRIDVKSKWTENKKGEPMLIYELFIRGEIQSPWLSRNEAYREVFKEADKIINEDLNK